MTTKAYSHQYMPSRLVLRYLSLFDEINDLKQRVMELENKEKVVVLREMTREEAKQAIRQLFSSGRTLYYSDIVQELGIELETVVEICNELEQEKEIAVSA
jgi:DNA invertase Pin-like site-specific DNA recombinase